MEYAHRLRALADELRGDLLLVMRVYFEKPRTTVGWKGYINDPRLDGSFRINEGLRLARQLLLEIAQLGLAAGTEFLDLLSPQYLSDLISWGAIGARTTESPSHRQLASGLSCAIGFKNGTDGGVQMAADALVACGAPHAFMGMTKMGVAAVFETEGNGDCHIILRGGTRGPNYAPADIEAACALLRKGGVLERVMVDCSHANSSKDYRRQAEVARSLAAQLAGGERRILGVMIESHLHEGRQDLKPGVPLQPGVSITDGCIGWEQTEVLLRELAAAVRTRRAA
jgi:3-deoxy-7-phosphoheptulonate synthase